MKAMWQSHKTLSMIFNLIKYGLIAAVVFTIGTQILIKAIPFDQVITSIRDFSNTTSNQIVRQVTLDIDGKPTEQSQLSFQTLVLTSVISAVISIVVISVVAALQVLVIVSVIVAIISTLILSQSRNLFEILFLVLGFAIPRQRKNWGTIRDAESNLPIPFATIRINQADETNQIQLLTQAIADLDGRYRIYLPDAQQGLGMLIKAPGYKDMVRQITNTTHHELIEDISMVRISGTQSSGIGKWLKDQANEMTERFTNYLVLLSMAGLVISLYSSLENPTVLSYAGVVIYFISTLWNVSTLYDRRQTNVGRIVNSMSNQPIESAFVKVFYAGQTLISAISDKSGAVKLNVVAGSYDIEVTKTGYQMQSAQKIGNTEVVKAYINNKGYLTKNIELTPTSTTNQPQLPDTNSALMNPFA